MPSTVRIAPSILAADLADLAGALQVCEQGGAEMVHFDVMDGHFVPNLSFGIPVLASVARRTELPIDVHLMVEEPERLLSMYLEAGAARVAVHAEATVHLDRVLDAVRRGGAEAGIAINPATSIEAIRDALPAADFVLLMSVNPGFGGQAFIPRSVEKTRRLAALIDELGLDVEIEVDGGVDPTNIRQLAEAGARTFVVGSALFKTVDPVARTRELAALARAGAMGEPLEEPSA